MKTNALYYGDCWEWMGRWEAESVDLIYLDPPFKSEKNYNQIFPVGDDGAGDAQYRAFEDIWYWDEAAEIRLDNLKRHPVCEDVIGAFEKICPKSKMLSYLTYMAQRLDRCYDILKSTGSIYLHCDPTASHYLKILMDVIFTKNRGGQYMNEIIWSYRTGGASKKHFSKKHDVILFYSKSNKCIFNLQKEKSYTKSESRKPGLVNYGAGTAEFFQDEHGVYNLVNCRDVWKISYINSQAKERLGYPTQKPEALLERIIKASSNEGDIVLDPFCGCGTAVAVAHKLNRRFVGIDISSFTIDLIMQKRLHGIDVHVGGMPSDFSSAMKLASENPYNFEAWAITRVPGLRPNTKRGSDGGTDGRGRLAGDPSDWGSRLVLAQVKGVKMFQLSALRDFMHVIDRDKAALGVFITLHRVNSRDAHAEAAGAGQIHLEGNWFPRMQLWSIEQFFDDPQVLPKLPTMMEPYTNKPLYPNLFSQP